MFTDGRCAVLIWSLGFIELNPPTEICNVRKIAEVLRGYDSTEGGGLI